jgi:WXXGXW repeat (2 copies)
MSILRFVRCSLALLILTISASSFAGVFVSVNIAPPALPVYAQPPCPGDGYIWTPGYWAYGPEGYYWVPGTWVTPPTVGVLWTPGYWGWGDGVYVWHAGYWGPHIGFYGGVNYGFGYFGAGYEGGYWRGRSFFYNRSVNNVRITNVHIYNKTVINNVTINRVSYNGPGGINARATREQERWEHERHFEPTHMQIQHEHGAGSNRAFLASENHGRPEIGATRRPGEFHGTRAIPAHSSDSPYRRGENHSVPRPEKSVRYDNHPQRQEMHAGRGGQPEYNSAHRDASPHQSAYHPENGHQHENAPRQRENAPRRHENAPRQDGHPGGGHEQRPH